MTKPIAPPETPIPRSAPAAEPVQETDRDELAAALRIALKEKADITLLQRHLDRMETAVRSGATLTETELLRHAHEVMMRLRRGVGAPVPAATPRRRAAAKRSPPQPVPLARPRIPRPSWLSGQNSQSSRAELKNSFIQDRDTDAAVRKVRGVLRKHSRGRTNVLDNREVRADFAAALNLAQEKLLHGERTSAKALLARWNTPSQRPADEKAGLSQQALSAAAVAVRGALKKAAREQRTTTWGRLRSELGSALPPMTAAERTRALTLVDEDSAAADQPLLSVLVAASNPVMARTYRQVVLNLGLAAPEEDDALFDVIEADTEHVHRFWKHR
ncbi:hypothetical protein ACFVIZ_16780 [Streptomyces anulatus]|uniref:hypothetical protein n=1 Tax=Streptomyces anulatus TaxID=1892 RepID=UPI003628945F